jgi:ribose transport system substrate-binding protein
MKRKYRVGLVMKSLNAEFFQEMKKGALEFARNKSSLELKIVGTESQTEIERQIELIDKLIREKVSALVVIPIDSKALVPVITRAVHADIKVINIDIRLDEDLLLENGIELTYVGPDNETAAKTVGDVLARKLAKGARIILIEGLQAAENAHQRKEGFLKSIAEHQLELVASEAADWETGKAENVFESLFTRHPDIDGVMCCNDAMALGVIKVLEKHGKAGKVKVVGFDNDASVQPLVRSGIMLATIDAFGSKMAVQGIEYAIKVLDGMENKGSYTTEFKLIQHIPG